MSTAESTPVSSIPLTLEQRLVARNRSLSPDALTHPYSAKELYRVIVLVLGEINTGERIQVTIPRNYSHCNNKEGSYDWDHIDEVQMDISGGKLRPNIFATLRFTDDDTVVIDIAHVYS